MLSTNISGFRKNVLNYAEQAIRYNQVVNITTKIGGAVMISLDDYNSLMETVYLFSHPATADDIREGILTPWEDCVPESKVSLT